MNSNCYVTIPLFACSSGGELDHTYICGLPGFETVRVYLKDAPCFISPQGVPVLQMIILRFVS